MPQRLNTSPTHKLILSPVGLFIRLMAYERVRTAALQREFRLGRIAAAAMTTIGGGVDEFLKEAGIFGPISEELYPQIEFALEEYALLWGEREEVDERWNDAFWSGGLDRYSNDQLVALEEERRIKSERAIRPVDLFGSIAKWCFIPMVKYCIPSPKEVFAEYSCLLRDPDSIYAEPPQMPSIDTSARILGPSGYEYFARFPSPSSFMNDTVYARVYEPENTCGETPTFIYATGLGMPYDQISYWPEEEYIGRFFSARGCRVILIESPWHGRRTPRGYYSGEYFMASAPVGQFQLYSAQVQETVIFIKWARSIGSSLVGVGGISLGGMVTEHIAGRCGAWSESARPDLVFLAASCDHIDKVAVWTELNNCIGLLQALQHSGWRSEDLSLLRTLLDPLPMPAIASDRIFAALGRNDNVVPFRFSRDMLRRWGVPDENVVVWNTGHFGVMLNMARSARVQNMILQNLLHHTR